MYSDQCNWVVLIDLLRGHIKTYNKPRRWIVDLEFNSDKQNTRNKKSSFVIFVGKYRMYAPLKLRVEVRGEYLHVRLLNGDVCIQIGLLELTLCDRYWKNHLNDSFYAYA